MLGISDLKNGTVFVMENDPWEVVESQHVMIGRGQGHLETKIRNLRSGSVLTRKFKQADKFEEADMELFRAVFVYANRGKAIFADATNPGRRMELNEDAVRDKLGFLVEKQEVQLVKFGDEVLDMKLPPKVDLRVIEATPWVKGDTASGGTKAVKLETGMTVQAPPFINEGDVLRINTQTGAYVERVEKK